MNFINSESTTIVLGIIFVILFFEVKPSSTRRVPNDESVMVDPTLFIIRAQKSSYISSPREMKELLIKYEGYRNCRYLDSKGIPTIGIGYNLRANLGKTKRLVGTDWPSCLSNLNIDRLYQFSIKRAQDELYSRLPWVTTMPPGVRDVLIRMSFNMGMGNESSGLLSFGNTLNLLRRRDFLAASHGFRMSKWCRDVKENRCMSETRIIEGALISKLK